MSFDKMLVSIRLQPIIAFIVELNKKMYVRKEESGGVGRHRNEARRDRLEP